MNHFTGTATIATVGRQARKEWLLTHQVRGALYVAAVFTVTMLVGTQINGQNPGLVLAVTIALPIGLIVGVVGMVMVRRQDRRERGLARPSRRDLRRERELRDRQAGW